VIPFSAFWLAIVLMMFAFVLTEAEQVDPLAYFMLPIFVAFGLYMLVGRFLVDILARQRTHYVLTDRRAVVESGLIGTNRASVNLLAATDIQLQSRKDGRGTVSFGRASVFFAMVPPSWPGAAAFLPPMFHDIEDAERVYDLAVKAQRDALHLAKPR
jgi:hypothetical protein